jgi:hypothetical protein
MSAIAAMEARASLDSVRGGSLWDWRVVIDSQEVGRGVGGGCGGGISGEGAAIGGDRNWVGRSAINPTGEGGASGGSWGGGTVRADSPGEGEWGGGGTFPVSRSTRDRSVGLAAGLVKPPLPWDRRSDAIPPVGGATEELTSADPSEPWLLALGEAAHPGHVLGASDDRRL